MHRFTRNLFGFVALACCGLCLAQDSRPRPTPEALAKLEAKPDQPDEAMDFFLMKRLPAGRDIDLVQRYSAAERHTRTLPRYSSATGAYLPVDGEAMAELDTKAGQLKTWRDLGPGNIGGRTRRLVVQPSNPNIMYAAGVTGGVWKSLDAGRNWRPLTDLLPNIAVSALVMDPSDSRILYAGTGEGVFRTGFRGAGIFKTVNSGKNWTRLASTFNVDFRYTNDLVISPNDPRRLYAATRTGVWRSRNRGNTWVQILDPQVSRGCLDLAIRTDLSVDVLFAACGNLVQSTVYRHAHAETGSNWDAVLTEADMGRVSLAIAPSDQEVIYALGASLGNTTTDPDYNNALHAVLRSDSGGVAGSWQATVRNTDPIKLNTLILSRPSSAAREFCFGSEPGSDSYTGQGWYDNVIAVDPVDPEVVYAGGIDLFRSDDGGRNWGIISYWWFSPPSAHADQHTIVFHPDYDGSSNRTMYVGNDGGLWRTNNARALKAIGEDAPCSPFNTRMSWTSLNNSYAVTQFYHGLPFPDGESYFGGTQDNGTILGTDEGAHNGWSKIMGGDGGYVAIDPKNPRILYAETQNLNLRKSTDGGQTFRQVTNGIDEPEGNFLFIVPFTMDPSKATRLWLGGQTLWRTTNGAQRWRAAGREFSPSVSISAVAVAPTNSNRVVAGLASGRVHYNNRALKADGETEWPSAVVRANAYISWLTFDPEDDRVVYATSSTFDGKHVFKSEDGGVSWEQIDGNGARRLPNIPVHSIVVDPRDTQRLYVGTDRGVYVSTRGGREWALEDNNFTHTIVQSMSIVERGNRNAFLFAFTHGRGAWRVTLGR